MNIGTVGTNFIVDTFIEAARKTGRAAITASYSRSPETAGSFALKHGIPKTYTDRAAFLAAADMDFVYVAAPNSLHHEWVLAALRAGKNVICEKPFVSNTAELRELISFAKERKLFLFEALTVPHLPNFRLIREKLPLLEPIHFVQLNFSQFSSRFGAFRSGKVPNLFSPDFSGGALMDLNCYNLGFMQRLFGEPEEIRYFANMEKGIDTSGALVLRYRNFIGTAIATKDSDSRNYVQIQGEKGYICAEGTSSSLRSGFSLVTKEKTENFNSQDSDNVLYYELLDFIAAFEAGDPAACDAPLQESLVMTSLMDRARADAGIVFAADHTK